MAKSQKNKKTISQEKILQRVKRRKRRARQIRGFVFLMFAVIGVIAVITTAVRVINSKVNPADDIEAYTQLISPLVSLNPIPFESVKDADNNILVESAIWAVLQREDTEKYTKNEYYI